MHFVDGQIPAAYQRYIAGKLMLLLLALLVLVLGVVVGISLGTTDLPLKEVFSCLFRVSDSARHEAIVWNIRLPQTLTAAVAGGGLAIAGTVMQATLRNPLGSPFTLGISHAAAFGAALAVMIKGSPLFASVVMPAEGLFGPFWVTCGAFTASLISAFIIIALSRQRGTSSEVMVLAGVALGALFTAGTMFLQFFADDVQLAAIVFWTFGDTARASWSELLFLGLVVGSTAAVFMANSWIYNALDAGDETARGLGIKVDRVRIYAMLSASFLTAVTIALLGIIGFVGLIVPHMMRRLIGADHRFLLPATLLVGGVLLVAADTAARLILKPYTLPVSVLTAFLGAPVFFFLVVKGRH